MKLFENPGQKLKKAVNVFFILGIVVIAIAALICIVLVSQTYYYESGGLILAVLVLAAIAFLLLWLQLLFISAYADMAEQLKRQTEILERLESKGGSSI